MAAKNLGSIEPQESFFDRLGGTFGELKKVFKKGEPNPDEPKNKFKFVKNLIMAVGVSVTICFLFWLITRNWVFVPYPEIDFWIKVAINFILVILALIVCDKATPERSEFSRAILPTVLLIFALIIFKHYGADSPKALTKIFDTVFARDENMDLALNNATILIDSEKTFKLDKGRQTPWLAIPANSMYSVFCPHGSYTLYYEDGTILRFGINETKELPRGSNIVFRISAGEDNQSFSVKTVKKKNLN
ncbi:MAG TPA: hypothetical protein PKI61_01625 [bacterium]|nr:hypothetical protein [bacterium]HPT30170.1 hypothetical protein [bacterium]